MIFQETKLNGFFIIEPEINEDDRGSFTRYFCMKELAEIDINFNIVQISRSITKHRGTIRGMHFQIEPMQESKIVQCLKGTIYDVVIDLRPNSLTYGQWVGEKLSGNNRKMFLIPKGFAHGFQTISNNCEVQYLMSEYYSLKNSLGVNWADPLFNIKWPIKSPILSEKDKNWPLIKK